MGTGDLKTYEPMHVRCSIFLLWGIFVCIAKADATTVYVTVDGDDKNDGLSWTTGKRTVGSALSSGHARHVILGAGLFVAEKPIKFGEDVPWVPNLSITGQVLLTLTTKN